MAKPNIEQRTFSAPDIAHYLGISKTGGYNLMQAQGFPSFRIGSRWLVTQEAFVEWLKQQQQEPKR